MNFLKNKLCIIILIIVAIVFSTFVFSCDRKSIRNATVRDLESVYDIGDKLAISIHDYVEKYDVDRVSELEGQIKYLGEKRLEELEDVYR